MSNVLDSTNYLYLVLFVYLMLSARWAFVAFSGMKCAGQNDDDLSEVDCNPFMNAIYLVYSICFGLAMPVVAFFKPSTLTSFWRKAPSY